MRGILLAWYNTMSVLPTHKYQKTHLQFSLKAVMLTSQWFSDSVTRSTRTTKSRETFAETEWRLLSKITWTTWQLWSGMQKKRLKDYENSSLGTGSNSLYNPFNIKPLKRQNKLLLQDFFGRLSADSLSGSLMLLDHLYFTGSGCHPCKVHLTRTLWTHETKAAFTPNTKTSSFVTRQVK